MCLLQFFSLYDCSVSCSMASLSPRFLLNCLVFRYPCNVFFDLKHLFKEFVSKFLFSSLLITYSYNAISSFRKHFSVILTCSSICFLMCLSKSLVVGFLPKQSGKSRLFPSFQTVFKL